MSTKNEPRRRSSRVIQPPNRLSSDFSSTRNTAEKTSKTVSSTVKPKKADKRRLSKSESEKETKKTKDDIKTGEWSDRKVKEIREFVAIWGTEKPSDTALKEEMDRIAEAAKEVLKKKEECLKEEFQDIQEHIGEAKIMKPWKNTVPGVPKTEIKGKPGFAAFPLPAVPIRKKIVYDQQKIRKMKYFEAITMVVPGYDETQLTHVPVIHDHTDDMAVCSKMYKIYPNGIHGYVKNVTEISDQLLYYIFKILLPATRNPDLLYYALYRSYPNSGSQKEMSEIFPKLVAKFIQKENKDEFQKMLDLEKWKPKNEPNEGDDDEDDEDAGMDPDFTGNYVIKLIDIRCGTMDKICSENCYTILDGPQLNDKLGNFSSIDNENRCVEIYVMKSCKARDAPFINELMSSNKKRTISNFCEIAKKYPEMSCAEWFGRVMRCCRQAVHGVFQDDLLLDFKTRDTRFRKQMTSEESARKRKRADSSRESSVVDGAVETPEDDITFCTIVPITPCDHFGPCGPSVDYCNCKGLCSIDCKCDINCKRKFPGCRCTKLCQRGSCPCRKSGWECNVKTCKSCVDVESSDTIPCCKNTDITKNEGKLVHVKTSEIADAGNGAFMGQNVEKDEYIGEYVGERISEEETERRGKFYELSTSYLFNLPGRNGSIDATRAGNMLRFVNHSKTPNCRFEYRLVENEVRIGFFSNAPIEIGDELTFDYRYDNRHAQRFFQLKPVDRVPKFKCYEKNESQKKTKYRNFNLDKLVKEIEEESRRDTTITRSGRISMSKRSDPNTSALSSRRNSFDHSQPSTSSAAAAAAAQHPIILSDDEEENDDL